MAVLFSLYVLIFQLIIYGLQIISQDWLVKLKIVMKVDQNLILSIEFM